MSFIKWFSEISLDDIPQVGGKTASLGEMYQQLTDKGIRIPFGFSITSDAYWLYIKENQLEGLIYDLLGNSRDLSKKELSLKSHNIRQAILEAKMPESLKDAIIKTYRKLKENEGSNLSVAVRSSATVEDLPEVSFAGQQETYLNIQNESELLEKCKLCFASLYTERAVSYRQDQGIAQTKIALSICIQTMIRSDLACSGVLFTLETESGFREAIVINSSWGLGENIVKGIVNPDDYIVFKPTLKKGYSAIIKKKKGSKESKLVYKIDGNESVKNIPTSDEERSQFCLSDNEIYQLSKWGLIIEEHYGKINGYPTPMDIEWAKDGKNGKLYILQARPETVHSQDKQVKLDIYKITDKDLKTLLIGNSIGHRIGKGIVRVIKETKDLELFEKGEVLVAENTWPDWEPYLKKSAAIITDKGGRTCHAAIISRELGIPAVVGTHQATSILETGQEVTVSSLDGDQGSVYEGLVSFEHKKVDIDDSNRPRTKIMMNLANPANAFKSSFIPNDGVGLARMEFIINTSIRVHPMALARFDELADEKIRKEIETLTSDYKDKSQYFVDNLSYGISTIAAAFYPKNVIVRFSDFKSNEYKNLLGGSLFEENEENPMLGFRGAFRYYHERYQEAFELECRAIKKVRNDMGLKNLKVMIPFCRTLEEGHKVIEQMKKNGLAQGENNLEVYVMCEIPSNAILAEDFAELFDGFSIGSNDLTQLTLGVDRDSDLLSPLFNENDPSVLELIKLAIKGSHKKGKQIGLCGQRPSDDHEFARFLVEQGIDSVSLNPDAILEVTDFVKRVEMKEL